MTDAATATERVTGPRSPRVLYTARATAAGGRDGRTRTDDGVLDVAVATPPELGGPGGGTNPEQLFAAGYASCFHSALLIVAGKAGVDAAGSTVTAEVGIGPVGRVFGLAVTLSVHLPGVAEHIAAELLDAAHAVCPYSNATQGNIPVRIELDPAG
ncbi:MAG TPA: organic hydroperoxide resistance protein [Jiangellales bacterium]|nr:organic hydroperoxide resistance protein [Jiangellales bacterium]